MPPATCRSASSCVGAGLRSARLNVDVNLGSIKDEGFVAAAIEEAAQVAAAAEAGLAAARAGLANGS